MIKPGTSHRRTGGSLLLLLLLLLPCAMGVDFGDREREKPLPDISIFVQVGGDVRFPGVYGFSQQPTPVRVMKRAGAEEAGAFQAFMEEAVPISSGRRLMVRFDGRRYRVSESEMSAFYKVTLGLPLSLNRESEEGFTAVPGIGPGLAKAIAVERKKRGGFKDIEELRDIRGVGQSLLKQVRPYFRL